jgi:hypothetical protein
LTVWFNQKNGEILNTTSSAAPGTVPGVGNTAPAVVLQAVVLAHEDSVPVQ